MNDPKVTALFPSAPCGIDESTDELVHDLRTLANEIERGERRAVGATVVYKDHTTHVHVLTCGKLTHHDQIASMAIASRLVMDSLLDSD